MGATLDWYQYQRLNYTFPDNSPRENYILTFMLVNKNNEIVSSNSSTVSYHPEKNRYFSSKATKTIDYKNLSIISKSSNSDQCTLGGIKTSNVAVTELSKATKRSMLALQIGSAFSPDSRLEKLYNGAKGAFNILKSGEKFCKKMQDFETALDDYDANKENNLTEEQASSLFAIDILIQTLSLTNGGSILYSGFNENDLVNGIKDYYAKANETARTISSIDNYASVYVDFDQPVRWFRFATTPVKLELTATPVFTYADGYESIPLKDVPKEYTDSSNINEKMIIMGSAKSDKTSFGSLDYRVRYTLKRGLYLLKATYKDTNGNDIEVFRDSIHVIQEAQEFAMMISR